MCKIKRPELTNSSRVRNELTNSSHVRKWSIVFAPEARRILVGGGTTGNADATIRPAPEGRWTRLVRRPSGAGNKYCPTSRWFHHRLISAVPPGRNSKAPVILVILVIIAAFAFN